MQPLGYAQALFEVLLIHGGGGSVVEFDAEVDFCVGEEDESKTVGLKPEVSVPNASLPSQTPLPLTPVEYHLRVTHVGLHPFWSHWFLRRRTHVHFVIVIGWNKRKRGKNGSI